MDFNYTNIYQRFRLSTGLTQEKASELIGKSVESLKAYENDKTLPPDEVVLAMTQVYNAPSLAQMHLSKSVLGEKIMPKLSEKSLSEAILSLETELEELTLTLKDLRKIGRDNNVATNQTARFMEILKEAKDVSKAISDLEFSTYTKGE